MTRHAFVTGFPIHHSRSPHIHTFWLQQYGIDGSYTPHEVQEENFARFIHSLRAQGFVGGNVTLPHKEQAFKLAEYCDEAAGQIGAANTLWFEGDVLCASNSDIYGFARNLDDFAPDWGGETALILGSGGAARAVITAIISRGFQRIILANRTRARAENLAGHFGDKVVVIDWGDINAHLAVAQLIVNTTSIGIGENGLQPDRTSQSVTTEGCVRERKNEAAFPVDFSRARHDAVVSDIVYVPLETPFLRAAAAYGLKTVDGLGMLLHQAVPGFERWFGVRPQVTNALRAHILATMETA